MGDMVERVWRDGESYQASILSVDKLGWGTRVLAHRPVAGGPWEIDRMADTDSGYTYFDGTAKQTIARGSRVQAMLDAKCAAARDLPGEISLR